MSLKESFGDKKAPVVEKSTDRPYNEVPLAPLGKSSSAPSSFRQHIDSFDAALSDLKAKKAVMDKAQQALTTAQQDYQEAVTHDCRRRRDSQED